MVSPMALSSLPIAGSCIAAKPAMIITIPPTLVETSSFLQVVSALQAAAGMSVVNCATVSDFGASGSSFAVLVSLDAAPVAADAGGFAGGGASVFFSSQAAEAIASNP